MTKKYKKVTGARFRKRISLLQRDRANLRISFMAGTRLQPPQALILQKMARDKDGYKVRLWDAETDAIHDIEAVENDWDKALTIFSIWIQYYDPSFKRTAKAF